MSTEPISSRPRHTGMRTANLRVVGAALLLTGCAATGAAQPQAARAPTNRTIELSSDHAPSEFSLANYTYLLGRDCFCANRGLSYRVTVRDGEVVRVEYAETARDHTAGDPAPGDWARLAVPDVIAIAEADDSESDWPDGQAYPDLVVENADQAAVDGATWYTIADVIED